MRPRSTFEEEMSRFEAEIGNKAGAQLASNNSNPYQQAVVAASPALSQQLPPQKYLGTTLPGNIFPPARPPIIPPTLLSSNRSNTFPNTSSTNQSGPFPPPPPAIMLNNVQSNSTYTTGRAFPSALKNFGGHKSQVSMSSAPTIYAAPSTNKEKTNDDDGDIMAILQKTEKEVKKDMKKQKSSTNFKPSSLSVSEMGKRAKLMADAVKSSTSTTIKTVQVPQSTKDRMLALKNKGNEAETPTTTSESNLQGTVQSYDGIKPPAHASINDDTVKKIKKSKKIVRTGGGQIWEDPSLKEWDLNDYRIFCGDLGNDVTDEVLQRTFGRYPSFQKAKVIRDKKSNKTKGFGFVSFRDPADFTKAMREMNGKYVGSRPIKMRKSNWKDRNIDVVRQKQKTKQQMGYKW